MTPAAVIYANKRQRAKLTQQGIPFAAVYDDYVLSDVTPAQVADLRTQGYEIELQDQPPVVQVRGRAVAMISAEEDARAAGPIRLRDLQVVRPGPPPDAFGPGPHYYLVHFIGPVKGEWLAEIQTHGGSVHDSMPPYAYVVGLDQPAYDWITTAPAYVRFVGHFTPELRLDPGVREAFPRLPMVGRAQLHDLAPVERAPTSTAERVSNTFVVRFFDAEDLAQGVPLFQALGATVGSFEPGATILSVSFAPATPDIAARLEQISRIHGVKLVEGHKLRQLYNNIAIGLMGGQDLSSPAWMGLSGRGEVVAVADSGLDTGDPNTIHPDFAGRVVALRSWPVSSDWSTVVTNVGGDDGPADARSGHGTHVAGSVCGNGAASAAVERIPIRGLAAEAKLVFQAVEQTLLWTDAYRQEHYRRYGRYPPSCGLAGLPVDLKPFFEQSYNAGARIHNDSWGGGDFGEYDSYAETVDRFMWEHKDFLILFAAGNDGADGDCNGAVDVGSVTPPGTAKNCLTVGAAESTRSDGGYQSSYGQLWPGNYSVRPLGDDKVSDNGHDVAAFSSRGPTQDGRLKPDLIAPGTNILSVRSQALQPSAKGWGLYLPLPDKYMFDGGTSMATPLVTGAAAVVRQYLRTVKGRRVPSGALVKATLIHAAHYRAYRFEQAAPGQVADMSQGWGHLDLSSVLAPPAPIQVRWYDNVRGLNTGESMRWSCSVRDSRMPLKITLAWTDYPGSAGHYPNLVNDLDLVVTSPSNKVYYGSGGSRQNGDRPDRVNNVERVIIPAPEAGRYQIRIRAFNVPHGPQDFALVYSGGIC
jgi:subtilisin family serine protease